jgi:hypothetical protein
MAMKRTELRRGDKPLERRTRLKARSPKRQAEAEGRRAITSKLAGCELRNVIERCAGPLDGHELVARGTRPGSHMEAELVVGLCRRHHELVTGAPPFAESVGARITSWAYEKWGAVVLEEAARRREVARRTGLVVGGRWERWEP